LIKQFEEAGGRVSSITVTVRFDEPVKDTSSNDLDKWMAKRDADPA
jgi:hypothetical protein